MCDKEVVSGNRILYIDDDESNTKLMKRVLEADGYEVLLASNGSMGLAQANRERPDLILLDIYMPDMSGHEVARRLRRLQHTRHIPIVMVSTSASSLDRILSSQAGCCGYITKPINIDCISSQVAAFL